jgi:hypothetical protein
MFFDDRCYGKVELDNRRAQGRKPLEAKVVLNITRNSP